MSAIIYSINISKTKGTAKTPVESAMLLEDFGVEGDAHAGDKIKQVSLLALESIKRQKECAKVNPVRNCLIAELKSNVSNGVKKVSANLGPGDFAENITTEGLNLCGLKVGQKLKIGSGIILEITKIGKECHRYCAIYYKTGDCIMPKEGVFAKVLKGGLAKAGDAIETTVDCK